MTAWFNYFWIFANQDRQYSSDCGWKYSMNNFVTLRCVSSPLGTKRYKTWHPYKVRCYFEFLGSRRFI